MFLTKSKPRNVKIHINIYCLATYMITINFYRTPINLNIKSEYSVSKNILTAILSFMALTINLWIAKKSHRIRHYKIFYIYTKYFIVPLNSSLFILHLNPSISRSFFTASPTVLIPETIIMRLPATSFKLHVRGL